MQPNTRKVAYAIILAALGVVLGLFSIPTGIARISPGQHLVNVLSAALLGPWYAVAIALVISIIRNILGWGTLLAFPGSLIGALLAGLVYRYTRQIVLTAVGEVIGTGILGALVGAAVVAPVFMQRPTGLTALIAPFFLSSLVGSVIALIVLYGLRQAGYTPAINREGVTQR